ncbi:sex hormone-binding globulin isoform X1 [Osmerus eperlanus]|uniref:sex hormone-binding globulin isoform X1 n=1 Tax=Osmerus eperlanus TaxID=29151 RepID=UPI002E145AE0
MGSLRMLACGLLLGLNLALLVLETDGQESGMKKVKKQVSGRGPVNLAHQQRGTWRPLMQTRANLSEVKSIKSMFELRTLDPEGAVFYGDTNAGEDWFVFSLRNGIPEMQIAKADILVSAIGGPKLNDGQWHQLGLSNEGKFVILEVDGKQALVVGLESNKTEEVMTGQIRLALGGILVDEKKLVNPFVAEMDGCVREGNWLNLTSPWETEEVGDLMPCFDAIKPGTFFSGAGLSVFRTSEIPIGSEEKGINIDIWAESSNEMQGAILNLRNDEQGSIFSVRANNITKELTLTLGKSSTVLKLGFNKLSINMLKDRVRVSLDDILSRAIETPDYLASWKAGIFLSFGGIPDEGDDFHGSQYLHGCIEKIQIQGKDVDLDTAMYKHISISSHSCPA